MNNKLKVRTGKTVYDARGNVLGVSGSILDLDAPIRESDRCKVLLVNMDATDAFVEPEQPVAAPIASKPVEVSDD